MRPTSRPTRHPHRRPAFTLIELLVVIAILLVMAALAIGFLGNAKRSANRASCMNRIRDVGGMLIGAAGDNGGRIEVVEGSQDGGYEFLPYFIVARQLDLPMQPYEVHYNTLRDKMFCPAAPPPKTAHLNSYGVNFNDSQRAGATWKNSSTIDSEDREVTVKSLTLAAVHSPANFLFVADSCRGNGQQFFRILGGDRVGLRHSGHANGFFLDGSARSLSALDLGKLGFQSAWDTETTPPKAVSLPRN